MEREIKPLERFAQDSSHVETLRINSAKGRRFKFDSWEYGINEFAAQKRDEDIVYFFRRCTYVVSLTNDAEIMKEFKERFFYVLPEHLREQAWFEVIQDRIEEAGQQGH